MARDWRGAVQRARRAFERLEAFGDAHERTCAASGLLTVRIACEPGSAKRAAVLMRCGVCGALASESVAIEVVAAAREMGEPEWLAGGAVEVLPASSSRPS